ncbi:MAG: flagellar basal body rod protein FlgB [Planctomycetota bacterium]
MLTNLPTSSTTPLLERVVQFTQARHGVLAGNIANLNTPDYRSRDLSPEAFEASLRDAIQTSRRHYSPGNGMVVGPLADQDPLLAGVAPGAAPGLDGVRGELGEVGDPERHLVYHDGRDVSLEHQVTEISKNQSRHNLAIALLSSQYRLLRAAISETVT